MLDVLFYAFKKCDVEYNLLHVGMHVVSQQFWETDPVQYTKPDNSRYMINLARSTGVDSVLIDTVPVSIRT